MKKLIKGIVDFRQKSLLEYQEKYAKLASGQSPDTLFIACCDSRVVPNTFASTDPGDLFVVRNIGNVVPPYHDCSEHGLVVDESVAAALEFSILELKVKDIVICGHSECAAMRAFTNKNASSNLPFVQIWLQHAQPSYQRYLKQQDKPSHLVAHNLLSQINVMQQIDHLKTYPWIKQAVENNTLKLHGWWFDLATADVHYYSLERGDFVLIDDAEAENIFSTL
jgi:carbonic anhydrase